MTKENMKPTAWQCSLRFAISTSPCLEETLVTSAMVQMARFERFFAYRE